MFLGCSADFPDFLVEHHMYSFKTSCASYLIMVERVTLTIFATVSNISAYAILVGMTFTAGTSTVGATSKLPI